MSFDKIFTIPFLSKELEFIGHSTLPYQLKKKSEKTNDKNPEENFKVVFDTKKMVDALITTCFELVKQIKTLGFDTEESELDKLKFEKIKLERQIRLSNIEKEKINDKLVAEKALNHQLSFKIKQLEKNIKEIESNNNKNYKKFFSDKNILCHNLQKKDSDLREMHEFIWKKFNIVNTNFFPENFKIIQLNQPNFQKLWSEVKYSSIKDKEDALKKAVCKFQEINQSLMESNIFLKNVILSTLETLTEVYHLIVDKMLLNEICFSRLNIQKIFCNIENLDLSSYKNFLNEHYNLFKKICELFEKSVFYVSDDIFVCWSDIVKKLTEHEIK